jgi:lipoprotein-releasing system permease protein
VYKLLLCLTYLRTRYLAFVCVGSVMLGVATLIVVNSVMSGFSNKLKTHLHGLTGDVTLNTEASAGFDLSATELDERLRQTPAGRHIHATSPTVDFFAMLQFQIRSKGQLIPITKMVRIVGIDPVRHAEVGRFGDYLVNSKGRPGDCFTVTPEAWRRYEQNRAMDAWEEQLHALPRGPLAVDPAPVPVPAGFEKPVVIPREGESQLSLPAPVLPAAGPPRMPGIVLGFSIAHTRWPNKDTGEMEDIPVLLPGDDVFVATIGSSGSRPVSSTFVVTDYMKSEMTEYDGNTVFVPLEDLQRMRAMDGQVNSVQIRLADDVRNDPEVVHKTIVPAVWAVVPKEAGGYAQSWWQQQGPLFAAIDIERGLLNILLFLIVGVAGFGVLAIFSMIVAEKYRDIGILKSLGAGGGGVLAIFIGYGLLLGLIGCGAGTALGLAITANLNEIEQVLAKQTGREIFDRKIYYFDKIPTNVDPLSVTLVNLGAVAIAVASSILPAVRAARLQPVRALRFE